jgi:hypothetical protein
MRMDGRRPMSVVSDFPGKNPSARLGADAPVDFLADCLVRAIAAKVGSNRSSL